MAAVVHSTPWDVDRRLAQLGLIKGPLIEVVRACVAAHAGCTDNDPRNTKGTEVYRWGVRRLREIYRREGFERNSEGGFETLVNRELRYRIAVVNTDKATGIDGDRIPQNTSRKGPASERAAEINNLTLPGAESWPRRTADGREPVSDFCTWHLCIYIGEAVDRPDVAGRPEITVRAELSLLIGFESGFFTDCNERIILIGGDDWKKLTVDTGPDDVGPEFDVAVERK